MKRLAATFLLSLFVQLAFAQWIVQPRVTTADLYQVRFSGHDTGWVIGQYLAHTGNTYYDGFLTSILRTTNGGKSWSEKTLNNSVLRGLTVVNSSSLWAVGYTSGGSGLICRTTNGGDSWMVVDSSAARTTYWTVQFLDEQNGFVGGWNDTTNFTLRTSNGGATWQGTYDKSLGVNEAFFWNETYGWNVGENGTIYRTLDGGATWNKVFQVKDASGLFGEPLRRIRFADWLHGCAVGGIAGEEVKVWTSDGGLTWNVVRNSPGIMGSSLHGLWFTDANNGWCVGGVNAGLTIQMTTDGGKTWSKQEYPSPLNSSLGYFEDVTFTTPTEGWIVADSGYILKTVTGGITPVYATAHRVSLDRHYARPSRDSVCIRTVLEDPSHHVAALSAIVVDTLGVIRDSIRLYNDGLHGDGSAGDSVWGCWILAPSDEGRFTVSVLANDTTFGMVTLIPDVQQFNTNGPIVYKGWTASTLDTITYPGSVIRVRIRLANASKLATVRNVTATISALDTMAYIGTVVQLSYGDIASGQESVAPATQGLRIQSYCPPNTTVRLLISISTEGFPAWTDTASIVVRATATEVARTNALPTSFLLRQNYPNPFNPSTMISYQIPNTTKVTLSIFNTLGQVVTILVDEKKEAGYYSVKWNANVPSGIYFFRLQAGEFVETKKAILLK